MSHVVKFGGAIHQKRKTWIYLSCWVNLPLLFMRSIGLRREEMSLPFPTDIQSATTFKSIHEVCCVRGQGVVPDFSATCRSTFSASNLYLLMFLLRLYLKLGWSFRSRFCLGFCMILVEENTLLPQHFRCAILIPRLKVLTKVTVMQWRRLTQ